MRSNPDIFRLATNGHEFTLIHSCLIRVYSWQKLFFWIATSLTLLAMTDKLKEREAIEQMFKTLLDNAWIVGVVGMLQFDVLADRIRTEYNLPVKLEPTSLHTARWVFSDDAAKLKLFLDNNRGAMALDHDGDPVFMARNAWHLNDTQDKNPAIKFTSTK